MYVMKFNRLKFYVVFIALCDAESFIVLVYFGVFIIPIFVYFLLVGIDTRNV